jgi:DNA primase
MRFSPALLDEIRARLSVSEVVGQRVRLRKQGREWVGLSPFNQEKSPSFFVNDQKGFYHCFSSGKHGDIFTFLMESEGLPFPEAVERLADLSGVKLPKEPTGEQPNQRRTLLQVVEAAARYFQEELRGPNGAKARAYVAGRGLSPETIARFRIGYAPPGRGPLRSHLARQNIPVSDMLDAGLLTTGDNDADPYERFRDRIIFPIEDSQGRVVAFGGRTLDPNVSAKYLNSPETSLFHKGAQLYNLHRARPAAHRSNGVVVVEGYVDAIALAQAGIEGVVAPMGTALTVEQLDLLWRLAPEPTLCFDGDGAGRRAAWRAIDLALPKLAPGKSLRFAFMPDGQDPDDLARSGGQPAVEAVLSAAQPLSEVLLQREIESNALDTPERRAELEQRLGRLLGGIGDDSVRRHYRAMADERLAALWAPAAGQGGQRWQQNRGRGGDFRPFRPGERGREAGRAPMRPSSSLRGSALLQAAPIAPREATLLLATINHPDLADRHCELFGAVEFGSAVLDALRQLVLHEAAEGNADPAAIRQAIEARGHGPLLARLDASVRARREWWAEAGAAAEDAETGFRHTLALHVKARALHNELRTAQTALAREPTDEHLSRVVEVKRSLDAVEGYEAAIEGFGAATRRAAQPV